jgi:hypothetical protein
MGGRYREIIGYQTFTIYNAINRVALKKRLPTLSHLLRDKSRGFEEEAGRTNQPLFFATDQGLRTTD